MKNVKKSYIYPSVIDAHWRMSKLEHQYWLETLGEDDFADFVRKEMVEQIGESLRGLITIEIEENEAQGCVDIKSSIKVIEA